MEEYGKIRRNRKTNRVDFNIDNICNKFKKVNLNPKKSIIDFCFNEPNIYIIKNVVNKKIQKLLEENPYTYINNYRFSGKIRQNCIEISWKVIITFINIIKEGKGKKYYIEGKSKDKFNCKNMFYCPIISSKSENKNLRGINYNPNIQIERKFIENFPDLQILSLK